MKKGSKIVLIVACVMIFVFGIFFGIIKIKRHADKIKAEERYTEIKDSVKKAVEWNISAMYPSCSISKEFKKTTNPGTFYNSSFLINNGYIKKSELLDIDSVSYCDVYVDINTHFENPLDQQHNCEIYYKIYLKCNGYEDKGYKDWGH